jgi:predicted phage terminase large subunit-like protein
LSADQFSADERFVMANLAREDLYVFTRWMFLQRHRYKWINSPHHKVICEALMRVYLGQIKRLIINVPPRYSKTELVLNFIAWTLGFAPDSEFILTSYSAQLATNNSWQIREMVQDANYLSIFPGVQLRHDSAAKHEWRTTAGGIVYAAGAGGTITGYGAGKHREGFAGALILDDPHKADEARSDVMRQNVINWFQTTLESRKNSPDTPIILIMQRLHERDLAGWLLDGGNGERWDHVCLPAIQADGAALWPEKHSPEQLRRMEQASPYVFAGQYMQNPAPLDGGLFKPGQLLPVDAIPAVPGIRWVRGWDFGATVGGDPSAGARLGRLPDGRFIIADMVHGDMGPDERNAAIRNAAALDGNTTVISIPQDPGQAGKDQVLFMTRMLQGWRVKSSPESGDKVTRAEPFASQVNVGNVLMLKAAWNERLIDQMRLFPNGRHDDQIDALSRAFAELMQKGTSFFGANLH